MYAFSQDGCFLPIQTPLLPFSFFLPHSSPQVSLFVSSFCQCLHTDDRCVCVCVYACDLHFIHLHLYSVTLTSVC